jgi:hypothetical protein
MHKSNKKLEKDCVVHLHVTLWQPMHNFLFAQSAKLNWTMSETVRCLLDIGIKNYNEKSVHEYLIGGKIKN